MRSSRVNTMEHFSLALALLFRLHHTLKSILYTTTSGTYFSSLASSVHTHEHRFLFLFVKRVRRENTVYALDRYHYTRVSTSSLLIDDACTVSTVEPDLSNCPSLSLSLCHLFTAMELLFALQSE